jgi:hypothetical protein
VPIRSVLGGPHGDRTFVNQVQKWPLAKNPIRARVYGVKTTVLVGVTGFPRGDDSEEVRVRIPSTGTTHLPTITESIQHYRRRRELPPTRAATGTQVQRWCEDSHPHSRRSDAYSVGRTIQKRSSIDDTPAAAAAAATRLVPPPTKCAALPSFWPAPHLSGCQDRSRGRAGEAGAV